MSQRKKDKLSKMLPMEALGYLKSRFINFISGVEPYPLKGVEIDYRNDNGTFRPTDNSVRLVFIDCDRKWRHYINQKIESTEQRSKFQNAFKKEISETWKRHSVPTIEKKKHLKNQY